MNEPGMIRRLPKFHRQLGLTQISKISKNPMNLTVKNSFLRDLE